MEKTLLGWVRPRLRWWGCMIRWHMREGADWAENQAFGLGFGEHDMGGLRQSTSAGHPRLTTGIPVGKPVGMKLVDPSFW
jgi:hypothetical protein